MTAIVLFDLGDVVASWDPSPRLAEYARRSGLSTTEVSRRLALGGFWEDTDRGVYSASEMHEQISARLGVAFLRDELLRLQALAFRIRPEVLRIAEELTVQHRVGVLSNNAPLLRDAIPLHFPELARIFAPVLFSFQFGHTKPEHALFAAVANALELDPADILFIDDKLPNVTAACEVGWDAFQFESAAQVRRMLVERRLVGDAT